MRRAFLAATLVYVLTLPAAASTVVADVGGSGDFISIGEALSAAEHGDTVLVMPGTYSGPDNSDLSFGGKDIVLRSSGGPDYTFIDHYSGWDVVFNIHEGETRDSLIEGFTVSDASAFYRGPAFEINGASTIIRNCRFARNYAWGSNHTEGWCGVGSFNASQGAIQGCVFEGNRAHCACGGVGISDSSIEIEDCIFIDNTDEWEGIGALLVYGTWATTIRRCLFVGNAGSEGCIYSLGSSYNVTVENCTFVDNGGYYWNQEGGGAAISTDSSFPMFVRNCIFAFNRVDEVFTNLDRVQLTRCCVYGNACGDTLGGDYDQAQVLWEDPRFCNMEGGDYRLCSNSPCLPHIGPWDDLIGAYYTGCGGCDSPVEQMSWGRIKAMYR